MGLGSGYVPPKPEKAPLSHYKHGSGLTGDAKIER